MKEKQRQEVKDLFVKYQKPLVDGLNHWALGTPFRKLLGIDKECKDKIYKLTDNSYHTRLGRRKFQATFRGYPVFAKRIGVALSKWDIVKEYITRNPKLYFGLDEYRGLLAQIGLLNTREFPIVMAASGDPIYAGSGDGFTSKADNTLATARANNATGVNYTSKSQPLYYSYTATNYVYRGFFPVDTSGLGAGANISAVTASYCCSDATASVPYNVVETTQASPTTLATSDHANFNTTRFSDSDLSSWTLNVYQNFTFNQDGIDIINKTGYTKLGCRCDDDIDGTITAQESYWIGLYFSEQDGTTKDPKLVVTYTAASTRRYYSPGIWR